MRKTAVMSVWIHKAVFGLCVILSAALCAWCAADNLIPIFRNHYEKWLQYAAGAAFSETTEQETVNIPLWEVYPQTDILHGGFEENGSVQLWREPEMPKAAATPDPNRKTGTVEVLKMNAGKKVDCFSVKDETGLGLDLEKELLVEPDVHIKKDGSPVVLLYSTHTTESFVLEDGAKWYYLDDDFRSLDPQENIVSVAEEAARVIEAGGFGVIHDKTVHDNPAYSGSYARSMETIQKNLREYPTIQITVDIHRDAFGENGAVRYKPVAQVEGKNAAQIMIMTGCDLSENPVFPDWRENLHLALRLQQAGETLFPGLYRPLYFCCRNYNMQATHGSLLVEIGTDVNTLEEAQYSGKLLGETILRVLEDLAARGEY